MPIFTLCKDEGVEALLALPGAPGSLVGNCRRADPEKPMPPSQPDPQDDEAVDAAPVGGHESNLPHEPHGAASSSRLSVRRESGGRLPPRLELHLAGELDADTAHALREHLAILAAHSTGGLLVLNLSGITFCDHPGLYTLLGIRRTLPLAGIDVQFTRASGALRAAAERAGLTAQLALGGTS
ncbi:STAS domain-containing protein [Streptomyces sp. NPDC088254]|uniref:STAS domain-containing protein n=1 Tax=Streptomyces sp. NPDC088254 TaxID=3365847 RepID=UPI00382F068A